MLEHIKAARSRQGWDTETTTSRENPGRVTQGCLCSQIVCFSRASIGSAQLEEQ